jgi:putative ABC transport system substrate-binding protein
MEEVPMLKKILLMIVSLTTVMALATGVTTVAQAKNVGLAWCGKSGMAVRVTTGLEKGLKQLAPQVKLESQKALTDIKALAEVIKRFQSEKDAMIILRSNGAKYLGKNPPTIPTFIGGCNNPVVLGALKNMQAPEGNITGVTYFLPKSNQFEVFKAILPDMKSVLLLVDPGNPSAPVDMEGTKKVCSKMGLSYNVKQCASKEAAIAAAKEAQGRYSVIIIGNQAVVIDSAKDIVAAAGKTPVVSYSSKPVKDGALGGFVADDEKLGFMLAQSLIEVLVKGKKISEVPVKIDPEPKFYVNAATAKKIGLEVPYNILESATVIGE